MRPAYLVAGLAFAILAWCLYGDMSVGVAAYFTERRGASLQDAALWGDSFGGFNALVSMIGAGCVVGTLWLQQRTMRAQERDIHRQRFESSFFELIRLMRELRGEIRFQHSKRYIKRKRDDENVEVSEKEHIGKEGIDRALAELLFWHRDAAKAGPVTRAEVGRIYDRHVARVNEYAMSPYFRMIYTILYRICADPVLSDREKEAYGNLVRSQLTSRELYLLAYNSCSTVAKDLRFYIERFRLFKYMRNSVGRSRIEEHFDPVAFATRT